MSKDPRVPRPILSNRLIKEGAWAIHTAPATIIKMEFSNLRCREAGVKEDPLLVHATRLAEELDALSAKDVQRVFGLPINLSRKLLEMLLYRDLIQESKSVNHAYSIETTASSLKKILKRRSDTERTQSSIRCLN